MGALQALLPLGIITVALGVGGTLLGYIPLLTRGEVRTLRRKAPPFSALSARAGHLFFCARIRSRVGAWALCGLADSL